MRYLAAYLLLKLGGNETPSADDIKKVLGSVGVDLDAAKAAKVIKQLEGKNIDEVIAEGKCSPVWCTTFDRLHENRSDYSDHSIC